MSAKKFISLYRNTTTLLQLGFNWLHNTSRWMTYFILNLYFANGRAWMILHQLLFNCILNLNVYSVCAWDESYATVANNDRMLTDNQRFSVLAKLTPRENREYIFICIYIEMDVCVRSRCVLSKHNDYMHTRDETNRERWRVLHVHKYMLKCWSTTLGRWRDATETASYRDEAYIFVQTAKRKVWMICAPRTVHLALWVCRTVIIIIVMLYVWVCGCGIVDVCARGSVYVSVSGSVSGIIVQSLAMQRQLTVSWIQLKTSEAIALPFVP